MNRFTWAGLLSLAFVFGYGLKALTPTPFDFPTEIIPTQQPARLPPQTLLTDPGLQKEMQIHRSEERISQIRTLLNREQSVLSQLDQLRESSRTEANPRPLDQVQMELREQNQILSAVQASFEAERQALLQKSMEERAAIRADRVDQKLAVTQLANQLSVQRQVLAQQDAELQRLSAGGNNVEDLRKSSQLESARYQQLQEQYRSSLLESEVNSPLAEQAEEWRLRSAEKALEDRYLGQIDGIRKQILNLENEQALIAAQAEKQEIENQKLAQQYADKKEEVGDLEQQLQNETASLNRLKLVR